MIDKSVEVRKRRRWLWFGANVTARTIVFVATLGIVIGAPTVAFLFLNLAGWTAGFWWGFLAGLIVGFAVWWAYLILYD